jgi:hypothetical protein
MAKEVLYVPEEHLQEVIDVIREGLKAKKQVRPDVRQALLKWCREEEEYLKG